MNAEKIAEIRARVEAFENANRAYIEHRERYPGFGSAARKLESQMSNAFIAATVEHATADLRALLDAHDADQERIKELETKPGKPNFSFIAQVGFVDEKDCPHQYAYTESGKLFCAGCGTEIRTVYPSE